jgi:hypothetical protein
MGLLEAVPFAGKWGAGTAGYISSHFPRAMMGQTLPQRVLMKTLGNPVVSGAMGQAARTGLSDFLLPFGTEEDAPEPDVPFSPKVLAKSLKGR